MFIFFNTDFYLNIWIFNLNTTKTQIYDPITYIFQTMFLISTYN